MAAEPPSRWEVVFERAEPGGPRTSAGPLERKGRVMGVMAERSERVLTLFEAYYERVYCFARRSLPAGHAEDISQEVFLRLLEHKNLEKLTVNVSYLIKIADNLIKRRFKRSMQFGRFMETANQRHESVRDATAASRMPALDTRTLDGAMGGLTCDERDAVHLIVCQDLSYDQAARSLGVSVSTINNWKYRGLRKLQDNVQRPSTDGDRPHGRGNPAEQDPSAGAPSRGDRSAMPGPPRRPGFDD